MRRECGPASGWSGSGAGSHRRGQPALSKGACNPEDVTIGHLRLSGGRDLYVLGGGNHQIAPYHAARLKLIHGYSVLADPGHTCAG
jgi:hypothetical protein